MAAEIDSLSAYLRDGRAALHQKVLGGSGGIETARAYSDLGDAVLERMYRIACERAGKLSPERIPLCIVATGGYGRKELCPHSDIDITFIPHKDGDAEIDRVVKEMFTLLVRVFMDANSMSVGYAYRLLPDCANLDHQTTSGLLDARLIAGSDRLFIQFEDEFWSLFNPAEFVFTKLAERSVQREKTGGTPRVVEPDLKEGPGGLRDLQVASWLTQAVHSLPATRARGDRGWEMLQRYSGLTESESEELRAAKELLFRIRNALHVLTGAERDQLVVTRQEEVAGTLGYTSSQTAGGVPPVEQFMRDFYGRAGSVDRICARVSARCERSRIFLGIGLDCLDRQVVPAGKALAAEDPLWVLWACELAQRYDLTFSDELCREIESLCVSRPEIADPRLSGEILGRILSSNKGTYTTLQRMADLGILTWLIPEVGITLALIPYDPSHDYTVGQHTLFLTRHLDSLRSPAGPEETVDQRRIMSELSHSEQLYMAALLHDAGKVDDDRPHSEVGEDLAQGVCERLRWDEQAAANVKFLVRHHLLMAETSRLRDLNLEETIRDFTAVVNDPDRLNMLYLLTYADTNAVGAGVWTQVKARFLRDLHRRAERALMGEESEDFDAAGLARARRRLLRELSVENIPSEEIAEHVESMPATYLLNTSLEEMALHIGFVRRVRGGTPVIDFHDERDSTFTEVTVCTRDDPRPGLLAKIAGVLYAADVDVHSAQVFTRVAPGPSTLNTQHSTLPPAETERIAIDALYVDFKGRRLTPGKRKELSASLTSVLSGSATVEDVLSKKRRPVEIGGPVQHLAVRNDLSESLTVIEVGSTDERAMLYRASGALSSLGWDIHSARVSHFRGKSMASFYVTGVKELSDTEVMTALSRVMPLESDTRGIRQEQFSRRGSLNR